MIIETGGFTRQSLAGKIAVVNEAGGGNGYEADRSLLWLGSRVLFLCHQLFLFQSISG